MANWVDSVLEQHQDVGRLPVAARDRFGLHLSRGGRQRLGLLSAAPVHYFTPASREWLPIDTRLQPQPDGSFAAAGLPVRIGADGDVSVLDGKAAHRQRSWRVGVVSGGRFHQLARLPDGQVYEDRLVREGGGFRHELILLPSGLREELTLLEAPAIAERDGVLAVETLLPGEGHGLPAASEMNEEFRRGALRFPPGWASDAASRRIPVLRWAESAGGITRMYTGVPCDWLAQARYPVVIDPDIALNPAADATIEGPSAATSSVLDTSSGTLSVGAMTFSGSPHLWRSYLKFNTSSLGPSAVVEQANLRVYPSNLLATVGWTIYVRHYNWSALDPLTNANRETAWDGLLAASNSAVLATNANPIGTFVTSANLPVAWVSILGNTYYGLWCNQEAWTFANGQGAFHQYASADNPTAGNRPLLMLEYLAGYPRGGPVALRGVVPQPRAHLVDTRRILRGRVRRTALHTAAKDLARE